MPKDFEHEDLTGAHFTEVNLGGAVFRDVDLRGARIIGSLLNDADISGDVTGLRINDVDVAPLIDAELDRRYPQRKRLRTTDAASLQDAWQVIEEIWPPIYDRARALPEPILHERVDGEWSLVETLRHLLFASDAWFGRQVLGEANAFHPFALPHSPMGDGHEWGIQPDADPTFAQALAARTTRFVQLRNFVSTITPAEYARVCAVNPAPGYPARAEIPVGACLGIIVNEEWWHHLFAVRDLAKLEARS
jgi:hypothetical protein